MCGDFSFFPKTYAAKKKQNIHSRLKKEKSGLKPLLKSSKKKFPSSRQKTPSSKPVTKPAKKEKEGLFQSFFRKVFHQAKKPAKAKKLGAEISSIRVVGLRRVQMNTVRARLFSQVGDAYVPKTVRGDVRRLMKTGYFLKVIPRIRLVDGMTHLVYWVQEKQNWILGVYFRGNRLLPTSDLRRRVRLRRGKPLDRKALVKDARRIVKVYHQMGYFRVQVTVQGRWDKQKRDLFLLFFIDEGTPGKIREIHLHGNRWASDRRLRELLDSQQAGINIRLTGRGIFHPSFVARDRYFLQNYYYDNGFLQAQIKGPRMEVSSDRAWVHLHYQIKEGHRFRYSQFALEGDILEPKKSLLALLKAKKGDFFNRTSLFQDNVNRVQKYYKDRGYAGVKVQVVPLIDPMKKEMAVRLRIKKGALIRIEKMIIKGHKVTKEFVIRRRILLKEGQLYHETKLRRSQRRIFALGYFSPTDRKFGVKVKTSRGTKPNFVVLTFYVREKSTWIYNFGLNYLPDFGLMFSGQLGRSNFLGRGQTVLARGLVSTSLRLWNIYSYFIEPKLLGSDLSLSLSGFLSHYTSLALGYVRDSTGGRASFSHPIAWPWLQGRFSYRLEQVRVTPEGRDSPGIRLSNYFVSRFTSSVLVGLQVDTKNQLTRSGLGMFHFLTYEHGASYLGSDYQLNRVEFGSRFYFKLPFSARLKTAFTVGWVGSSDVGGAPVFERYNLGGIYTIRGFALDSITPRIQVPNRIGAAFGQTSLPWGGNKKLMFNIELEVPLLKVLPVSGVLFFDAGNTYTQSESLFGDKRNTRLPLGLYMSLGFGFRFRAPGVGVMRFEWGIPLTRRASDPAILFGFTVGETIF